MESDTLEIAVFIHPKITRYIVPFKARLDKVVYDGPKLLLMREEKVPILCSLKWEVSDAGTMV